MTRRILTPAAAMRIKQLYEEEDQWGRKVHTQMAIAKEMGVSETTVYRVIHSGGAYMAMPEPATEEEAEASAGRFAERFPDLVPEGSGMAKLAEVAEERGRGDRMIEELRGPLDEED